MGSSIHRALHATGLASLALRATGRGLRILEYHGICRDEDARADWMPAYFVPVSAFRAQMEFVRRRLVPLPLREAVDRLRDGTLPRRAVCVTFDDGYANNLHLAQPVLRERGIPFTVFVATGAVETGDWMPFLRLAAGVRAGAIDAAEAQRLYKDLPMRDCVAAIDAWWPEVASRVDAAEHETLRSLTAEEVGRLDPDLCDLGAHTVSHVILANETRADRDREIRASVATVQEWSGRVPTFCYPNGTAADFDDGDQRLLAELGVPCATTTIRGANRPGAADPYALRRLPVGLHHDEAVFASEVSLLRTMLRRWFGR